MYVHMTLLSFPLLITRERNCSNELQAYIVRLLRFLHHPATPEEGSVTVPIRPPTVSMTRFLIMKHFCTPVLGSSFEIIPWDEVIEHFQIMVSGRSGEFSVRFLKLLKFPLYFSPPWF